MDTVLPGPQLQPFKAHGLAGSQPRPNPCSLTAVLRRRTENLPKGPVQPVPVYSAQRMRRKVVQLDGARLVKQNDPPGRSGSRSAGPA